MKTVTQDVHEAISIASRFAEIHFHSKHAYDSLTQLALSGNSIINDSERLQINQTRNLLDAISGRTSQYEAQKYTQKYFEQTEISNSITK